MNRTLLALAATALLCVAPAVVREATAAEKMTLDDLLDGYYEAIGGLEAWESVSSARMKGKLHFPDGSEFPFTMVFKVPGKVRLEFVVQGMTGVQAVSGKSAWQIMPFMGKPDAEPMPEDQARLMIERADFDGPLVHWKEDGNTLEYLGTDEVEGTEVYKLKVTLANGEIRTYFLDADAFLPIKGIAKTTLQGQEAVLETTFGDYKEVGGLVLPHSIEQMQAGAERGQVFAIDETELNVELADDQFSMPVAAKKPTG